jgi:hypothetical protein
LSPSLAIVVADNPISCEAIARIAAADLRANKMRLEDAQCVRVEQAYKRHPPREGSTGT